MATPYDGKVSFWHVQGDWVLGVPDIESLIGIVKQKAPATDAVFLKATNGTSWIGVRDTNSDMAVKGPDDIARWVSKLNDAGLECHVWCVVQGLDVPAEIALVTQAASVAGVKSLILDVEPYADFWRGDRDDVTQLMTGIRSALGQVFHIGMSVDPRANHYQSIYPDAWQPFVNSIHSQIYWGEMQRTPRDVLDETYEVWAAYGLPIYPVLQCWKVTGDDVREAQNLARSMRGAQGLSYFRLGAVEDDVYPVVNETFVDEEIGPDWVWRRYDWQQVVGPDESGHMDGTHIGQPSSAVFQEFTAATGHKVKYKATEAARDTVWSQWTPKLPAKGLYELSIYVPGRRATTRQAQYHIHGVTGIASELLVRFNQYLYYDEWVPVVVYEFSGQPGSGRVNLTDLTGEADKKIAFTAIRWRRVVEQRPLSPDELLGFDSPVGTEEERRGSVVWPATWIDKTGYGTYYSVPGMSPSYHTGADLNLRDRDDLGEPVYACAAGQVIFSGRGTASWGEMIIIKHNPLSDGTIVWSRYAHLQTNLATKGDMVKRGQHIGTVGDSEGRFGPHLHFDIAKTNILEINPNDWPGSREYLVYKNYHDPLEFIRRNRPPLS